MKQWLLRELRKRPYQHGEPRLRYYARVSLHMWATDKPFVQWWIWRLACYTLDNIKPSEFK